MQLQEQTRCWPLRGLNSFGDKAELVPVGLGKADQGSVIPVEIVSHGRVSVHLRVDLLAEGVPNMLRRSSVSCWIARTGG